MSSSIVIKLLICEVTTIYFFLATTKCLITAESGLAYTFSAPL